MKFFGIAFLFIISLVIFTIFSILTKPQDNLSPVPGDDGVRVIYVTITPGR